MIYPDKDALTPCNNNKPFRTNTDLPRKLNMNFCRKVHFEERENKTTRVEGPAKDIAQKGE